MLKRSVAAGAVLQQKQAALFFFLRVQQGDDLRAEGENSKEMAFSADLHRQSALPILAG